MLAVKSVESVLTEKRRAKAVGGKDLWKRKVFNVE